MYNVYIYIYAPTASYTHPTGIIPLMSGGLNYQLDAYSSYTVDIKYRMLNRGAIYVRTVLSEMIQSHAHYLYML